MLYTKKGDDGKTELFSAKGGPASGWGCDQRFSKSSIIAEALGSLDELNSFLGILKSRSNQGQTFLQIQGLTLISVVHEIQENLFIIQAQVAGVDKKIFETKISDMEKMIDEIEKKLPPIKTFIIPGVNEISAMFDFARTLARKTERRVVAVSEEKMVDIDANTLKYLNRLSSLLFALARFSALESGKKESNPTYS
ncbi:MAG: cob(I)yrinic acid a,c-diamide adenosyltransferase [Candidatus Taylorbacteria bacterium]|nr:cob(I)yrinic acid a,c-diamide adenosyltransferase [Candidatus Taylorbacteria bacterium]